MSPPASTPIWLPTGSPGELDPWWFARRVDGKCGGMSGRVDAKEAHGLIESGATVIDVLPASVFDQEHLPGALSVPLETFEPAQLDATDRTAPVVVYCFDQH